MKTIDIELSVFQALEKEAVGFGVTPNDVIKRLLARDGAERQLSPSPGQGNVPKADSKAHPLAPLLESPEYICKSGKVRYFDILRLLYKKDPEEFSKLNNFRKGSRVQISTSKEDIENSGRNTLPQILEDTPYWVLTNLSNERKRDILNDVLRIVRYPSDFISLVVKSVSDSRKGLRGKYLTPP